MEKAKKLCALLMALALMVTAGCGNESVDKNSINEAANIYIEKAQKYVDEKDYAAAIDILQLGLKTIDDKMLEEMLNEVIELQIANEAEEGNTTASETGKNSHNVTGAEQKIFDISRYISTVTYWATEGMDWICGGYALGIYISESSPDKVYFEFSHLQSAPDSRNAVAATEIPLSEIDSNEIVYSFENDGWGHSGKVTLTFEDDSIMFAVNDVMYTDTSSPEVWGFYNESGRLVSNPTIYDDLYYTEEEYNALFGEREYIQQEPIYDTSKASGILASLGMTEQEFRDSCLPLDAGSIDAKTTAFYIDCEDLLRYPDNYIGQHFVISTNLHDYFPCQYCNGREDSCASSVLLEKYDENGRHWTYRSDLATLMPEDFYLINEGTSSDGYPCYSIFTRKPYCYIFDMRDNIYSPNITTDANVTPYLIFLGLTPDRTDLRFAMITCDVSFK